MDLHHTRSVNGFGGANAITYSEIHSYCNLFHHALDDWEIYTIRRLDNTVLSVYADHSEKLNQKQQRELKNKK